ncbi:hypothetical protein SNEBB_002834 [Seison nebaliae]|nr:hypothetical protein SNEBB_002834 [Seison nebaliae]
MFQLGVYVWRQRRIREEKHRYQQQREKNQKRHLKKMSTKNRHQTILNDMMVKHVSSMLQELDNGQYMYEDYDTMLTSSSIPEMACVKDTFSFLTMLLCRRTHLHTLGQKQTETENIQNAPSSISFVQCHQMDARQWNGGKPVTTLAPSRQFELRNVNHQINFNISHI